MSPPRKRDLAREAAMLAAFTSGKTLQEIADASDLSRQRVGQILKRLGATRLDGGAHKRKQIRNSSDS